MEGRTSLGIAWVITSRYVLLVLTVALVISQTSQTRLVKSADNIAHAQTTSANCPIRPLGAFKANVGGSVTTPTGAGMPAAPPIGGLTVKLEVVGKDTFTTTVASTGSYSFSNIEIPYTESKVVLTVSGSGYHTQIFSLYQKADGSRVPYILSNGSNNLAPLVLERPSSSSIIDNRGGGKICPILNGVPRCDHDGVANATVKVYRLAERNRSKVLAQATTNEFGSFSFTSSFVAIGEKYVAEASVANSVIAVGMADGRSLAWESSFPASGDRLYRGGMTLTSGVILEGSLKIPSTSYYLARGAEDLTLTQNERTFYDRSPPNPEAGRYQFVSSASSDIVPGDAILRLGFPQDTTSIDRNIKLRSGWNPIDWEVDLSLICGSIGLKDTQLMFQGVKVSYQSKGANPVEFTTNNDGYYRSFNEEEKSKSVGASYSITARAIKAGKNTYKTEFPVEEVPFFARLARKSESFTLNGGVTEKVEAFREEDSNGINASITFADGVAHPKSAYRIVVSRIGVVNPKTRQILISRLTNSEGTALLLENIYPTEEAGKVNPLMVAAYALDRSGKDRLVSKEYRVALKKGEVGEMKLLTVVIDTPIDNDRNLVTIKAKARLTKGSNPSPVSKASVKLVEERSGEQITGETDEKGTFTASLLVGARYDLRINSPDLPTEYRGGVYGLTRQDAGATKASLSIHDLTTALWGDCFDATIPNIRRLFFCGEESIAALPGLKSAINEISAASLALSKKYPSQTSLVPTFTQVVDLNRGGMWPPNASVEFRGYDGSLCPPEPKLYQNIGRYYNYGITFDLAYITKAALTPTVTRDVFYHEDGHLFDAMRGGDGKGGEACKLRFSQKMRSPFNSLWNDLANSNLKETEWSYISDRTYHADGDSKAGHPEDNPAELYASAFMIGNLYRWEFNELIDKFPAQTIAGMNAKKTMIEAVRLATDF